MQKFDLENEGQGQDGEKRDLCHLIGNVRFHTCTYACVHACTHIYVHGVRDRSDDYRQNELTKKLYRPGNTTIKWKLIRRILLFYEIMSMYQFYAHLKNMHMLKLISYL